MSETPTTPMNVDWALDDLVEGLNALCAVAVSTDGMLIQRSRRISKDSADSLAARASSLASIARGISRQFGSGPMQQTIVEMKDAYLVITAAGPNACLAVLADVNADLGQVGYEMNRLVKRVGVHLGSQPRDTTAALNGGLEG